MSWISMFVPPREDRFGRWLSRALEGSPRGPFEYDERARLLRDAEGGTISLVNVFAEFQLVPWHARPARVEARAWRDRYPPAGRRGAQRAGKASAAPPLIEDPLYVL